ncbi:MAG: Na-K-Cl cotransporter [Candidatus Marinimicrobia bacterium]|nr:Na-K-Cl cotransporter [Candidatus Neomarinimicrobiota bacterium]
MKSGYQFGWFKGVYTPSVLTIFGVVMYLRFGWVLGHVGLSQTILIVLLANAITILTAISLSALATNMHVAGGGAYFIISRSLGLEPGAAIGLPLFLAQTIGISFYIAGFAESLVAVFPQFDVTQVGVITLLGLTVLAYTSANLALKSQFIIMAAIAVSLISFFAGHSLPPSDPVAADWAAGGVVPPRLPFWAVFAVFFPAVTGIEAGISMSGDLKSPARALPLGTLAACLSGLVVYLAIPIYLSIRVPDADLLLTRPLIMRDVARWGNLILLGVWGASLSSAMGALLGAPRTLQALARDGLAPRWLGRGFGAGQDPRLATCLCFAIALGGILAGGLNLIGPVLSMFFLTSYGVLNFSAGVETLLDSPSWRPRFRAPGWLSLLGAVGCAGVMLMINVGATLLALLICAGIYFVLKRRRLQARWGDLRTGIMMFLARQAVYRLAEKPADEHSWKPNLLVLSGPPAKRWYLIELADAIAQENCLVTVALVMAEDTEAGRLRAAKEAVTSYLRRQGVRALVKVVTAPNPYEGGRDLISTYGFGPLTPNTILIGETEAPAHFIEYAQLIRQARIRRRNLVIVRQPDDAEGPADAAGDGRIDLWWRGEGQNASFMLTLAHLLGRSGAWSAARLTLNAIADDEAQGEALRAHLAAFIAEARIEAEHRVLIKTHGDVFAMIREQSRDARLVFIGLRPPGDSEEVEAYSGYYETLLRNTQGLPLTALVLAGEGIDFGRIFQTPL